MEFLGAPFDKNGSFWIFKPLKTLPKGLFGLKYFKIIIFLLLMKSRKGVLSDIFSLDAPEEVFMIYQFK